MTRNHPKFVTYPVMNWVVSISATASVNESMILEKAGIVANRAALSGAGVVGESAMADKLVIVP